MIGVILAILIIVLSVIFLGIEGKRRGWVYLGVGMVCLFISLARLNGLFK